MNNHYKKMQEFDNHVTILFIIIAFEYLFFFERTFPAVLPDGTKFMKNS